MLSIKVLFSAFFPLGFLAAFIFLKQFLPTCSLICGAEANRACGSVVEREVQFLSCINWTGIC